MTTIPDISNPRPSTGPSPSPGIDLPVIQWPEVSAHFAEFAKPSKPRIKTQEIWVTFAKHGIHRYPTAPDEVAYLRIDHRHLFKFKVSITVHHDDREIEFHMFQNWLMGLYEAGDLKLDHKSCEMIASDLITMIEGKYDCTSREVKVEVSEDGECGAVVSSLPRY
jgi:hypothetical protein